MRIHPLLPLFLLTACAGSNVTSMGKTGGAAPPLIISTDLVGNTGNPIGTASVRQEPEGTRVLATITGLPPGTYALHLHAVGRCETPDFITAGGHFNPAMKQHGSLNPMGEHAGDLPNIEIGADRKGSFDALRPGLRLVDGTSPLIDIDGAAIVLHAGPDDYKTDPAGNAGARIACGVLAHGRQRFDPGQTK
nr:superoxide dismutase family protein [Polymorphobacter sp.]